MIIMIIIKILVTIIIRKTEFLLIIIVTNVFRWEDVELPNGEKVSEADSGEYKHLGVVELDIIICRKVKKSKRIILKNNIFTDEK